MNVPKSGLNFSYMPFFDLEESRNCEDNVSYYIRASWCPKWSFSVRFD